MGLCAVSVQFVDAARCERRRAEVGKDFEGVLSLGETAEFVCGLAEPAGCEDERGGGLGVDAEEGAANLCIAWVGFGQEYVEVGGEVEALEQREDTEVVSRGIEDGDIAPSHGGKGGDSNPGDEEVEGGGDRHAAVGLIHPEDDGLGVAHGCRGGEDEAEEIARAVCREGDKVGVHAGPASSCELDDPGLEQVCGAGDEEADISEPGGGLCARYLAEVGGEAEVGVGEERVHGRAAVGGRAMARMPLWSATRCSSPSFRSLAFGWAVPAASQPSGLPIAMRPSA